MNFLFNFRKMSNLFRFGNDDSEDEELNEVQRQKNRLRKRLSRPENEPAFKGKVNLSLKDLQNADELWLVKLPRNVSLTKICYVVF